MDLELGMDTARDGTGARFQGTAYESSSSAD